MSRSSARLNEGGSPPADHRLEAFIRSQLGVVFPSAVLLVQQSGELLWHQAYGILDPQERRFQTQLDSLFDLASLTKLFTATAFMRLVERGMVSLDTSVGEVLPALRGQRWIGAAEDPLKNTRLEPDPGYIGMRVDLEQVTFRRLLTHSSGLAAWRSVYAVGGNAGPITVPYETPLSCAASAWKRFTSTISSTHPASESNTATWALSCWAKPYRRSAECRWKLPCARR